MSFAFYIYKNFAKVICRCKSSSSKDIVKNVLEHKTKSVNSNNTVTEINANQIAKQVSAEFPDAPTSCCQTGCPNCVWLEYADKLSEYYHDLGESSDDAIQEMMQNVEDGNLRAYLLHEIRMKKKLEE